MMNSVLKNMENFAKDVLKLPTEAQNELFKTLEETLTPRRGKRLKRACRALQTTHKFKLL
jgi:hypothetical protein